MSISSGLANLAIRTKIVISFAAVMALLGTLAATALSRLSAMNTTTETITTDYVPSVLALGTLSSEFADYRGLIARQLVSIDNAAEHLRYTAEITDRRKIIVDHMPHWSTPAPRRNCSPT